MQKKYPDISDLLTAKMQRRKALMALPWEEKVAIIEHMRQSFPKGKWKTKIKNHDQITNSLG
jgi:hypothetical protein